MFPTSPTHDASRFLHRFRSSRPSPVYRNVLPVAGFVALRRDILRKEDRACKPLDFHSLAAVTCIRITAGSRLRRRGCLCSRSPSGAAACLRAKAAGCPGLGVKCSEYRCRVGKPTRPYLSPAFCQTPSCVVWAVIPASRARAAGATRSAPTVLASSSSPS